LPNKTIRYPVHQQLNLSSLPYSTYQRFLSRFCSSFGFGCYSDRKLSTVGAIRGRRPYA